ncbi:MAG: GGDEF domain-containing protein [Proteobacteria bacterium]|nr:GGDEF domain-containing protein [Pseudomonadota bacterium]
MKVEEAPPVQSARRIGTGRSVPPPEAMATLPDGREERRRESGQPHDIAALHGIDEDDLTPEIRAAVGGLIAEVASLREALAQSGRRLDYLNALADQDSISPTLNRRAFVRELSRALAIARQYGSESSLMFLEIEDLKELNVQHGLAAGDAAIEHVAAILQERLSEGGVIGRLGGAEFGLIMIGEGPEEARLRGNNLAAAVAAQPLIWDGQEVWLALRFGIHSLRTDEDARTAMDATDRVMRHPGAGDDTVDGFAA